eukprot:Sdes_comp17595_c0_seq1m6844
MRIDDDSPFREGVVLNRPTKSDGISGSIVDVGARKQVKVNKILNPGTRVTVDMKPELHQSSAAAQDETVQKSIRKGIKWVVSPSVPCQKHGIYWGYSVRLASSLSAVLSESPYPDGYDLTIGTSDKGESVLEEGFSLGKFSHLLLVFGGLEGLEMALDCDEELHISDIRNLFDRYINTCPGQGSGTIRTEEAVLITLGTLRKYILNNSLNDINK